MNNITLCNNCAGTIVISLNEHTRVKGLVFCCIECADHYFSDDNYDDYPCGLAKDIGVE